MQLPYKEPGILCVLRDHQTGLKASQVSWRTQESSGVVFTPADLPVIHCCGSTN